MYLLLLSIACFISTFMLVWFKSDAFVEWMKLFGLGKFIKFDQYIDAKLDNMGITYPLFLKLKYNKFIFKIIGCNLCFGIWLSAISSIFISASIISFIGNMSVLYIMSLFIFGIISKIINENK
jgi:hypothetical protein